VYPRRARQPGRLRFAADLLQQVRVDPQHDADLVCPPVGTSRQPDWPSPVMVGAATIAYGTFDEAGKAAKVTKVIT